MSAVRRCEFGLCARPAEHEVVTSDESGGLVAIVAVCGLHVTPVVTWGVPVVPEHPVIRPLSTWPAA